MPWFWSDQYDLKLQMAGLSSGYDECHIIGDTDSAEFIACYGKDGHLIAVDSVNPVSYTHLTLPTIYSV